MRPPEDATFHLRNGPRFRLWLEGIQLRPETNNDINFIPIRLCFINVYTYTYPNPKPTPYNRVSQPLSWAPPNTAHFVYLP